MNGVNFVPLGSVVLMQGGTQKIMVVARGVSLKRGEKTFYFDYGGVLYPQGLMGNEMAYFNHLDIRSLVFIGCNDADNQTVVQMLNDNLEKHPELERCTIEEWQAANNE